MSSTSNEEQLGITPEKLDKETDQLEADTRRTYNNFSRLPDPNALKDGSLKDFIDFMLKKFEKNK